MIRKYKKINRSFQQTCVYQANVLQGNIRVGPGHILQTYANIRKHTQTYANIRKFIRSDKEWWSNTWGYDTLRGVGSSNCYGISLTVPSKQRQCGITTFYGYNIMISTIRDTLPLLYVTLIGYFMLHHLHYYMTRASLIMSNIL